MDEHQKSWGPWAEFWPAKWLFTAVSSVTASSRACQRATRPICLHLLHDNRPGIFPPLGQMNLLGQLGSPPMENPSSAPLPAWGTEVEAPLPRTETETPVILMQGCWPDWSRMPAECCLQMCLQDLDWFPPESSPETVGPTHCWYWLILLRTWTVCTRLQYLFPPQQFQ